MGHPSPPLTLSALSVWPYYWTKLQELYTTAKAIAEAKCKYALYFFKLKIPLFICQIPMFTSHTPVFNS